MSSEAPDHTESTYDSDPLIPYVRAIAERDAEIERLRASLDAEAESARMLQERVNRLVEGSQQARLPDDLIARVKEAVELPRRMAWDDWPFYQRTFEAILEAVEQKP